ncbi:hypothetical protein M431DRAFT_235799 [Trichoderma harzianum CBS 226.95]|uniref:Uncharacterized protein n=1 Tax=Trichoderma harzianum CBS 226.95 TaxID=983964 RepID=A0A2T4A266_TRIHA|nr:hypothetical protein M431DRAFT_235799 [Trichoderma harzianum CBS 226.95]PTB51156.1 hypothetical protein M431DRAFT_235799 [Trichoderma harzianum CBS 226.95]
MYNSHCVTNQMNLPVKYTILTRHHHTEPSTQGCMSHTRPHANPHSHPQHSTPLHIIKTMTQKIKHQF